MKKLQYKDRNKSGVYQITIGPHFYIGSSCDLYGRLNRHLNDLKRNMHHNDFMQRVFLKYTEDQYSIKILELCENQIEKEKFFIDLLNPDINIDRDPVSAKKSDSTKEKIKILMTGKYMGKDNPASVKIYQYDLLGNYIRSFDTHKEAADFINGSVTSIQNASKGKTKSANGFQWTRVFSDKIKPITKINKKPYSEYSISCTDSDGNVTTYTSMATLAADLNTSFQNVYMAIKNNRVCKGKTIKLN
jgi:group I intron endonuclease